jgi:hypothetical protein
MLLRADIWFAQAWGCLTQGRPPLVATFRVVFEEAFDFLLTLLSVACSTKSLRRLFNETVGAIALVRAVLMVIVSISSGSPDAPVWLSWRGLYVIAFHMAAGLRVESIIRVHLRSGTRSGFISSSGQYARTGRNNDA